MIMTTVGYGILLTDSFGDFYKEFNGFKNIRKCENISREDYSNFLYPHLTLYDFFPSCESSEELQFIMGVEVHVRKSMKMKEIHRQWLEYMEELPIEIKKIVEQIKTEHSYSLDPDFHILSGEYR